MWTGLIISMSLFALFMALMALLTVTEAAKKAAIAFKENTNEIHVRLSVYQEEQEANLKSLTLRFDQFRKSVNQALAEPSSDLDAMAKEMADIRAELSTLRMNAAARRRHEPAVQKTNRAAGYYS